MNDPVLSRLGLARRANLLAVGTEAVKTALQKRKAHLVLLAQDISAKSEKEFQYLSKGKVPMVRLPADLETVGAAIGIRAGILAVTDEGMAKAVLAATQQP